MSRYILCDRATRARPNLPSDMRSAHGKSGAKSMQSAHGWLSHCFCTIKLSDKVYYVKFSTAPTPTLRDFARDLVARNIPGKQYLPLTQPESPL